MAKSTKQNDDQTTKLLSETPHKMVALRPVHRRRVAIDCSQNSRTRQEFKTECDINVIMGRYMKTGIIDFVIRNEPRYGDVTGMEFQSAMEQVAAAKSMFNELPSELRKKFENNPAKFLDFVNDDNNRKEAAELGLLKPEAASAVLSPTPPPTERAPSAPAPTGANVGAAPAPDEGGN